MRRIATLNDNGNSGSSIATPSRLHKPVEFKAANQTELAGYLAQEASIIEQNLVDMFRAKGTSVVNGSRKKAILHTAKKNRK
jgi:hypothetical protein